MSKEIAMGKRETILFYYAANMDRIEKKQLQEYENLEQLEYNNNNIVQILIVELVKKNDKILMKNPSFLAIYPNYTEIR